MRLDQPLDDIFASTSHVRVLRALFALPWGMGRSGRDLARRAGVSHPRANQVLADLAEQGLVAVERLPRTDLYRLNRHHALAEPLGSLFELEPRLKFELLSLVASELKARHLPVKEARIFGSAARGAMSPTSDVDLALTTSRESVAAVETAAQEIAERARERFGTRLNVLVGSPSLERLARSRQAKQGVWQAIEREGIDVLAASEADGERQNGPSPTQ
jgi:predicted nucleotidyltransferase/DNA-binding transcriptional ArsR family regulator